MKRLTPFLVTACLAATPALAQDMAKGDKAAGEKLFMSSGCYECHGTVGEGSGAGPHLVGASSFLNFLRQLRRPRSVMPPYEAEVLSDAQVADIFAYVQSLPPPADPASTKLLSN